MLPGAVTKPGKSEKGINNPDINPVITVIPDIARIPLIPVPNILYSNVIQTDAISILRIKERKNSNIFIVKKSLKKTMAIPSIGIIMRQRTKKAVIVCINPWQKPLRFFRFSIKEADLEKES